MAESKSNYFDTLSKIDVGKNIEKKNGLSYLSWPFAWGELKKRFPDATYTVYENSNGWNYFTDGRTCWVKTGVTVNGIEHIEYLPIMDFRNKSILTSNVTSFDVNKAIQRSLTKAIARHGLGLYIYAGEDLPAEAASTGSNVADPPVNKDSDDVEKLSYRVRLRNYCEKYYLDKKLIVGACNLKANSTEEEWKAALEYAKQFGGEE